MDTNFRFAGENPHLDVVIDILQSVKAENVTIVNGGEESAVADWIVICEGNSFVHVNAIANTVRSHFKTEENILPFHEEGRDYKRWILLDYTDVVVNIMLPELRDHYELEELWKDCDQEVLPNQ